jgi:hypothetical protein
MKLVVILSAVEGFPTVRERSEKGGLAAPSGDGKNLAAFGCVELTSSKGLLDPPRQFSK